MRNLKGKTATKKCIIIPVEEHQGLYVGEKGCYLNLTAIEMREPKYRDTHCIKPNIPKDEREAMTEEEQRALPILGGLHAIEAHQQEVGGQVDASSIIDTSEDDLPF